MPTEIIAESICIDRDEQKVLGPDGWKRIPKRQWDFLMVLAKTPGRTVPIGEIMKEVYDRRWSPDRKAPKCLVQLAFRLRSAIGYQAISSSYNIGYMLELRK